MDKPKPKKRPWNYKSPFNAAPMANRKRDEFYHTSRWRRESKRFLQQHALCAECEKEGILTPAEVTDHIIPKSLCADPWEKSNWQPLCKKHNVAKGLTDKKLFKK